MFTMERLVLLIFATYCTSMTTPRCQNKTPINLTDSKNQSLENILELIRSLDTNIAKILRSLPLNENRNLLNLIKLYNEAMRQFIGIAAITDRKILVEYGEDVIHEGGPVFLEIRVTDDDIREKFKWKEEYLKEMHVLRQEAVDLWTELQKYL